MTADLVSDEHCPAGQAAHTRCRPADAMAASTHCDCWYEDNGCHACGTTVWNLVVLDSAESEQPNG